MQPSANERRLHSKTFFLTSSLQRLEFLFFRLALSLGHNSAIQCYFCLLTVTAADSSIHEIDDDDLCCELALDGSETLQGLWRDFCHDTEAPELFFSVGDRTDRCVDCGVVEIQRMPS